MMEKKMEPKKVCDRECYVLSLYLILSWIHFRSLKYTARLENANDDHCNTHVSRKYTSTHIPKSFVFPTNTQTQRRNRFWPRGCSQLHP